jgi:hypothetical protein
MQPFPPDEPHSCYLFHNRRLAAQPLAKRRGAPTIAVPLQSTHLADDRCDFLAALMGAIHG